MLPRTLLTGSACMPRVLGSACSTRNKYYDYGLWLTKPPAWFVPRKRKAHPYPNLTRENKEFLKEAFEDSYTNVSKNVSPLKDAPWQRNEWTTRTNRTGLLGVKIGVLPQWDVDGNKFFTTLVQILDNHVIRYTPPEKFKDSDGCTPQMARLGLGSVVVGALSTDPFPFAKSYVNLFKESGVPPKRRLTRFLVTEDAAIQPGTPLNANHFRVGQYVDVHAKTIGHGFQGVVKRWGMKGGPASHGATKWHRRGGTISSGRDKAKVYKGTKMPGKMGFRWRHHRGLKIHRINTKYNVLYLHGPAIPGPTHSYVRIMDTRFSHGKLLLKDNPPYMPTYIPEIDGEDLPEDIIEENVFDLSNPTITFGGK